MINRSSPTRYARFLRGLAIFAALLAIQLLASEGATNAQSTDTVRIAVSTAVYNNLPIFLAVDKGYFAQQHLDVQVRKIAVSSLTLLPTLARGDLDISPMVAAPGFFNQYSGGFDVKLIASIDTSFGKWNDTNWLLVRQDLWESGSIRSVRDLKGKHIDAGTAGSAPDYLVNRVLPSVGLTLGDVTYTHSFGTPVDWFTAFRNKAVDAQSSGEPFATQAQAMGLAHKLASTKDFAPGFQSSFLAASAGFLKDHPDAVRRFLVAYVQASREIAKANGRWTPELVAIASKWMETPAEVVQQIPGPAYTGNLGAINETLLESEQRLWVDRGLVKTYVPISDIVDLSPLNSVLGRGIK